MLTRMFVPQLFFFFSPYFYISHFKSEIHEWQMQHFKLLYGQPRQKAVIFTSVLLLTLVFAVRCFIRAHEQWLCASRAHMLVRPAISSGNVVGR